MQRNQVSDKVTNKEIIIKKKKMAYNKFLFTFTPQQILDEMSMK